MKVELKFAELQTPLFLEGVNHGTKIDPARKGVKLLWDQDQDKLIILFKGKAAIVPMGNVASMTPENPDSLSLTITSIPLAIAEATNKPVTAPQRKIKAQVSTPTSHVFAGEKEQ